MSAILLNENLENGSSVDLPENFSGIHSHNLYLYVKSYQASLRANTAVAKTRAEVSGGGKKPWAQKGGGRARAGSRRSPIFVGGGQAFGPRNNKNYDLKVNKKQKKLALKFALNEQANNNSLLIVDSIAVESGKTKDAKAIIDKLNKRDILIVKEMIDEQTFRAFANIQSVYLIEANELNGYLAATFHSVVIEKAVWENLIKES
jgi:large subunit ribosomal protein L4